MAQSAPELALVEATGKTAVHKLRRDVSPAGHLDISEEAAHEARLAGEDVAQMSLHKPAVLEHRPTDRSQEPSDPSA